MREKLLKILEKNARIDINNVAIMLGVSVEEVLNEIVMLEKEQIICGYHTMINWDFVDSERCSAFIEVKVTPQRGVGFDNIANRIMKYPEVDAVYLMAGDYDFAVLIEGRTMKEVSKFVFEKLSTLDTVTSCSTHFVLKRYKEHGVELTNINTEDKRMKVSA